MKPQPKTAVLFFPYEPLFIVKLRHMKKFLSRLILAAGLMISVAGCGLLSKLHKPVDPVEPTYGNGMLNSYVMEATAWQVDSICNADALPSLDEWIVNSFQDFETGENIVKYMYIKRLGDNEIIYIIMGQKEPFNVTRRITQ